MSNIEVLLSCMNQDCENIVFRSNLNNVRTLVVNQCDVVQDDLIEYNDKLRCINTGSRGLSRSRNMAIENSVEDICVLSDDDEFFVDDLAAKVIETYLNLPQADLIVFKVINVNKKLGEKVHRLKKYECLRVSSQQITFKRQSILGKVNFDILLGAGTGNGAGEENKFLLDCYKRGLKIYYVPIEIATVQVDSGSTWFFGFDKNYFFNRGKTTRYVLGLPISILYAFYFLLFKHKVYKKNISFFSAFKYIFKGIRAKSITEKI